MEFIETMDKYIFEHNGWTRTSSILPKSEKAECSTSQYSMDFLVGDYIKVYCDFSGDSYSIGINGSVGVQWLSCEPIENCDPPYIDSDLEDMETAFDLAEWNLLKIGIPFVSGYKFHGKSSCVKKRRNNALRERLKISDEEERLRCESNKRRTENGNNL